ncbi:hypothetical protein ABE021_04610 [Sporosarcina gallistercoris]|uniref:hypothetical protein n=1 Tax=Sporosarcina gallistercoris TaxID=2762245 RepID=UPI003D28B97F
MLHHREVGMSGGEKALGVRQTITAVGQLENGAFSGAARPSTSVALPINPLTQVNWVPLSRNFTRCRGNLAV